jgi:hypothetical protein
MLVVAVAAAIGTDGDPMPALPPVGMSDHPDRSDPCNPDPGRIGRSVETVSNDDVRGSETVVVMAVGDNDEDVGCIDGWMAMSALSIGWRYDSSWATMFCDSAC